MLTRQNWSQQSYQNQQMQSLQTAKNIQIANLRRVYPDLIMLAQTAQNEQYRIPFMLPVSSTPLFVKITVGAQFPNSRPQIHMMSSVQHQSLDPTTTEYKGTAMQNWNANSSLAQVVQYIHNEFKQSPPLPKSQGSQPQAMQASAAPGSE